MPKPHHAQARHKIKGKLESWNPPLSSLQSFVIGVKEEIICTENRNIKIRARDMAPYDFEDLPRNRTSKIDEVLLPEEDSVDRRLALFSR